MKQECARAYKQALQHKTDAQNARLSFRTLFVRVNARVISTAVCPTSTQRTKRRQPCICSEESKTRRGREQRRDEKTRKRRAKSNAAGMAAGRTGVVVVHAAAIVALFRVVRPTYRPIYGGILCGERAAPQVNQNFNETNKRGVGKGGCNTTTDINGEPLWVGRCLCGLPPLGRNFGDRGQRRRWPLRADNIRHHFVGCAELSGHAMQPLAPPPHLDTCPYHGNLSKNTLPEHMRR